MSERPSNESAGVLMGAVGVLLVLAASLCLLATAALGSLFLVLAMTVGAVGLYFLVAGAVARGVQVSRAYDPQRWTRHEVPRSPRPADDEADVLRP